MKRLLSFLLPIAVMLSSCKDNLQITGTSTVAELDGKTLYLKVFEDGKMQTIDSTVVAHGGFTLNAKVDSVTMACLFMGEMCLVPVVLESGSMTFEQARLTLDCRKLFKTSMHESDFVEKSILNTWYGEKGGLHDIYVVEIENVYTE